MTAISVIVIPAERSERRDLGSHDGLLHLHPRFKKGGRILRRRPSDLIGRIYQHKHGLADGFTKKYRVKMLVYYEIHDEIEQAIRREKSIKRWTRSKKITAIEEMNPTWTDLYSSLFQIPVLQRKPG